MLKNIIIIYFFFWSSGFSFLFFHLMGLLNIFAVSSQRSGLRSIELSLLLILAAKAISLTHFMVVLQGVDSPIVLLNVIYTELFWFIGFGLVFMASRSIKLTTVDAIGKQSCLFIFLAAFLGGIALLMGGTEVSLDSIGKSVVPPALQSVALVRDSLTLKVVGGDWSSISNGERLTIFSPYATALAMTSVCLVGYYNAVRQNAMTTTVVLLCNLLAFSLVVATFSRTGLLCSLAYLVSLSFLRDGNRVFKVCALTLTIILGVYFALISINTLLGLRADSSDVRLQIYIASLVAVVDFSPILGLGIRGDAGLLKDLGSHSTLVGLLYKNGILGLLAGLILIINMLRVFMSNIGYIRPKIMSESGIERIYRAYHIVALIPVLIIFLLFEDVDAPAFACFLFFMTLAKLVWLQKNGVIR